MSRVQIIVDGLSTFDRDCTNVFVEVRAEGKVSLAAEFDRPPREMPGASGVRFGSHVAGIAAAAAAEQLGVDDGWTDLNKIVG